MRGGKAGEIELSELLDRRDPLQGQALKDVCRRVIGAQPQGIGGILDRECSVEERQAIISERDLPEKFNYLEPLRLIVQLKQRLVPCPTESASPQPPAAGSINAQALEWVGISELVGYMQKTGNIQCFEGSLRTEIFQRASDVYKCVTEIRQEQLAAGAEGNIGPGIERAAQLILQLKAKNTSVDRLAQAYAEHLFQITMEEISDQARRAHPSGGGAAASEDRASTPASGLIDQGSLKFADMEELVRAVKETGTLAVFASEIKQQICTEAEDNIGTLREIELIEVANGDSGVGRDRLDMLRGDVTQKGNTRIGLLALAYAEHWMRLYPLQYSF